MKVLIKHDLVLLLLFNWLAKVTGILLSGYISEKQLREMSTIGLLVTITH